MDWTLDFRQIKKMEKEKKKLEKETAEKRFCFLTVLMLTGNSYITPFADIAFTRDFDDTGHEGTNDVWQKESINSSWSWCRCRQIACKYRVDTCTVGVFIVNFRL